MCKGIELELRDQLDFKLATFAVRLLNHAMQFGPLSNDTEWFNNDDKCAARCSTRKLRSARVLAPMQALPRKRRDASLSLPYHLARRRSFAGVMASTLHLQHMLAGEVYKLFSHLEKPELSFRGWAETGPVRRSRRL